MNQMCSQNMHHCGTLFEEAYANQFVLFWLIDKKKVRMKTEAPLRLITCGLTVSESTLRHKKEIN